MKFSTPIVIFLWIIFYALTPQTLKAQNSVLNPADTVATYDPAHLPAEPPYGQIGKWIRTKRLSWNTDSYKAYIYKGVAFRIKFPRTYDPNAADGKRYPMFAFFHGLGEPGPVTDNEFHLYHGAQDFASRVDNGIFDGYVIALQSQGFFGGGHYQYLKEIIDYMVINNKLDPFQVVTNGLSAGAQATWEMALTYPTYVTAAMPMSGVSIGYKEPQNIAKLKYTPIWNFNGGKDDSPAPSTCDQVKDAYLAAGGNYRNTTYPDLGHGTWFTAWTENDFWPFVKSAYASNPWPLFGRTEFCTLAEIQVTLGLTQGFNAYQWRKDGVLIPAATSNTLQVTQPGVYEARILRGSVWSDWSHSPVNIKIKAATVTPPITISGMLSPVFPSLDTNTSVKLQIPKGYETYKWQKVGNAATVGTAFSFNAPSAGQYIVMATEQYGCSSNFSAPFTVIDANGPNKPAAPGNLLATSLSKTSIRLNWTDNPAPQYNETAYEVYQGTKQGGPYTLIGTTAANAGTFTVTGLNAKTTYYYKVRGINLTAGSAASNEAKATTAADNNAPSAPSNVKITNMTSTAITLGWAPSTDDVAVTNYEIYINGVKSYVTKQTQFTVSNLEQGKSFLIKLVARDLAGNQSPFSNQVTAQTISNGLKYKYYTYTDNWSKLPDFNTLTPVATGIMENIALAPRTQDDKFAFLWEGFIKVPVAGTYTFATLSDEGSRLYLGPYSYGATPLVDNDGSHGEQIATGTITLDAGIYPIAISYFEGVSSENLLAGWIAPWTGGQYEIFTSSMFLTAAPEVSTHAPVIPSELIASAVAYNRIDLQWKDNSTDETGFEIFRSLTPSTGFSAIGVAPANTTQYIDSTLNAATLYYYRVRAIGPGGESGFVSSIGEAAWKFNNDLADASGNAQGFTTASAPAFDAASKVEGTHSLNFNGSGNYLNINSDKAFGEPAYTEKTISFWMKASFNLDALMLVDLGGKENGLSVALYQNNLYAAMSSNNVQGQIGGPYTNTDWNHVAVVYKENTLRMYINGTEVSSFVSPVISSIAATTDPSGLGQTNGTNAFNIQSAFYKGGLDNVAVYSKALSAAEIMSLKNNTFTEPRSYATTLAPPPAPLAPTNILATATSTSALNITWTDNATSESKYEVLRSDNNVDFTVVATLPVNSVSFSDSALFSNTTYYYKINAIGIGGPSATPAVSVKTKNHLPFIVKIANRSARYGITTVLNLTATDEDVEALTFTIQNKPAFATFVDNGDKTATLSLNPTAANQAIYNGIRIIVKDTNGGADSTTFNLTVNDNYDPVMAAVADYVTSENTALNIPLSATDLNAADVLTWSVTGLPNTYSLTPGANGSATINLQTGFAASGVYPVQVSVNDGKGGTATRSFSLTVNDKDPHTKIYVHFSAQGPAGAPWNSVTSVNSSNFKDASGNTTSVGLSFDPTWWWATFGGGTNTGNNSGIYPDAVMRDYFYFGIFGGPETVNVTVKGLDPAKVYNLSFFAGSAWGGVPDNGTTTYTVGSQTVSLYVQNNTKNAVSLNNLKPAANGTITYTMGKAAGTPVGYISALVITSLFDDGTAPVMPKAVAIQNVPGEGVQLSWSDAAYNETGYEVHRSLSAAGPFTKVGASTTANATTFLDNTVNGNVEYFYKVRAVNTYGQSALTDAVTITTINRVPTINAIANVVLKNNQQQTISVTALDDATDHVTLTASGLPPFVTFTDNGNGTGLISILPTAGASGFYQGVTITGTDNVNASRSISFDISIVDKDVSSVYLNFSDGTVAGKPWNDLKGWPFAGSVFTNLLDDSNVPSGISVTYVDGFEGVIPTGMRTGNGKTVYPETVLRTALVESSTNARTLRISGLSASKKYNFVFFNSREDGLNGLTNFTINGQTVTLLANYNIDKTVQINGISPDANGQVVISVKKGTGASYAFLSSLVIQSYSSALALISPVDLRVKDMSRNTVSLQWADRSSDETGFEIWRAASQAGSQYARIATVGANTTTFTDALLTQNTTYHYIVRAAQNTTYSSYSNVASATTYSYGVSINFTIVNQAPVPWNNLNAPPEVGYVWNDFMDDAGKPSSTGMTITLPFAGLQPLGMNTGNNSGIFPDKVMMDDWILFPGEKGGLKITGLNVSMKYNFTFFGSTQAWGDYTAAYTINNKPVYLDASLNTTGTVTFYDVTPDENGEVNITVAPHGNAGAAVINALIVNGYNAPGTNAPQVPGLQTENQPAWISSNQTLQATIAENAISAYPNPFHDQFTLSVPSERKEKIQVAIFDLNGKLVFQNLYNNLEQGNNYVRINTGAHLSKPGLYLIKVLFAESKKEKVFKLIKH